MKKLLFLTFAVLALLARDAFPAQVIDERFIPGTITRDANIVPTGESNAICITGTPGPTFGVTLCSTLNLSGKTVTLPNNAVGNAHLRDSAGLSVIGRSADSSGDPADIVAGTDGHVLRRSGAAVGFGQVVTAGIADGAVTAGKINPTGELAWSGILHIAGQLRITGTITPELTGSSTNNWAPAGLADAGVVEFSATQEHSVTGLTGGVTGRTLFLFNTGANTVTLVSQSGSSTDVNRFSFQANLPIPGNTGVIIRYINSRWRVAAASGSGGAGFDTSGSYELTGTWDFGGGKTKLPFTTAAGAPAEDNDNTAGFFERDIWFNTEDNLVYMAASVATGAAVWHCINCAAQPQGLSPNFAIDGGNVITGADESKPVSVRGSDHATTGLDFYVDSLGVVHTKCVVNGVRDDCHYIRNVPDTKKAGFADDEGNEVFIVEAGEVKKAIGLLGGFNYLVDFGRALEDTDDIPKAVQVPFAQTIVEVCATVTRGTGTSVINLQRNDGSPENILESDLTATTSGACTTSFASGENVLEYKHFIDFTMVEAAATGAPEALLIMVRTRRD